MDGSQYSGGFFYVNGILLRVNGYVDHKVALHFNGLKSRQPTVVRRMILSSVEFQKKEIRSLNGLS